MVQGLVLINKSWNHSQNKWDMELLEIKWEQKRFLIKLEMDEPANVFPFYLYKRNIISPIRNPYILIV